MTEATLDLLGRNERLKVAVSALCLLLCLFATYYFLIVLKTSIVYTQLFYVPIVITCAWWGRKGIIVASSIVIFFVSIDFFFAKSASIVDNLARSAILLTVSVLTSTIFAFRKKTEDRLWKSEQRWATTLASIGDAVIATNPAGEITFMNAEAEKLTGWTQNEASKKPVKSVFKVLNERTREEVDNPISIAFETGKVAGLANHTILMNKNGAEIAVDDSAAPIRSKDGEITGVVLVFRDISERRLAEKVLTDLKDFNEGIIESISEAVLVIDPKNYMIVAANSNAARELNTRKEELIGKTCYAATHNSLTPCEAPHDCPLREVLVTGKVATANHIHFDKNQNKFDVEISVYPFLENEGEITKVVHIARNITERKRIEDACTKQASLIDLSPDAIIVKDIDDTITFWNTGAEKLYGYTKQEAVGQKISILLKSNYSQSSADVIAQLRQGKNWTGEITHYTKSKNKIVVQSYWSATLNGTGEIVEILESNVDITERKSTENALAESQKKYQTTFEASMDALMLLDEKGFFDCNKATLDLYGCKSVEEFAKFHPADLSPPAQPDGTSSMDSAMSHIRKAFQTGTDHFFWIHKRTDGTTFPADVLLTRMSLKDREVLQATVRDITELKKAEEANKFQADLLNQVGQAVIMVDNNRTICFWNKAAEKLYGYPAEQAVGQKVNDFLGGISSEEADETLKRLMAGESWSTEILTKKRDGSVVPVILNRTPIYKENGEFLGAASITTDITLQKNIEADLTSSLNSLSNSLDKIQDLNEKLRVVGSLTRHDVRNKLSAVTGYAYILKKKHSDQSDVVDGLGKMEQSVQEIVKIFDFAKMYEQIGAEELTYINVEEKLREATALFSGPMPQIINRCHGLTLLADSFLRQLFFNFIDNTRKYGKKTTTIKVYFEKADNDKLKLIYEDDGVGVPFENKPRLFSEGFSTGGSTGFGLFLTKKMMDVYGWTIQEVGEPGKGAKFAITIPKLSKNGKENYQIAP